MKIDALEIDDVILEKIEVRHGVSFEEAEETCYSRRAHVRRTRSGLYKVFGGRPQGATCL